MTRGSENILVFSVCLIALICGGIPQSTNYLTPSFQLQQTAAGRHLARRTTQGNMASSSSGAGDWEKTSEPRVNYGGKVGKRRMKMNYTTSKKTPSYWCNNRMSALERRW